MARGIAQVGSGGVYNMNTGTSQGQSSNFGGTAAGWTMIYWFLSVIILLAVFMML